MADIPEDVDLDALLAPVTEDAPTGPDLRNDDSGNATYFRLRDARSEARAAERQADSDGDLAAVVPPQWRTIRSLAMTALATESKDLEIAAWLTEAMLRIDGIPGLIAGSQVLAGLVERFWDTPDPNAAEYASDDGEPPPTPTVGLYPMPDEDGMETRVIPVTGLNGQGSDGTLIQSLRKLPLFRRPDGDALALWQYDQSAELSTISDEVRRQQRLDAGVLPYDTVENEARAAGVKHFLALQALLDAALQAWQAMADAFDAKAGSYSPPTSRVRDILAGMRAAAHRYSGEDEGGGAEAGSTTGAVATTVAGGGAAVGFSAAGLAAGPSASREDALRLLGEIAAFFQRTEPHSPLSYTLQEAARRGRMTWPELLQEVVPDYTARAAILSSLGIRPEQSE